MNAIEQRVVENDTVGLLKFFSFLRGTDKALLIIGTVSAILAGGIMPMIAFFMGGVA